MMMMEVLKMQSFAYSSLFEVYGRCLDAWLARNLQRK